MILVILVTPMNRSFDFAEVHASIASLSMRLEQQEKKLEELFNIVLDLSHEVEVLRDLSVALEQHEKGSPDKNYDIFAHTVITDRFLTILNKMYDDGYLDVIDGVAYVNLDAMEADGLLPDDMPPDVVITAVRRSRKSKRITRYAKELLGWDLSMPRKVIAVEYKRFNS